MQFLWSIEKCSYLGGNPVFSPFSPTGVRNNFCEFSSPRAPLNHRKKMFSRSSNFWDSQKFLRLLCSFLFRDSMGCGGLGNSQKFLRTPVLRRRPKIQLSPWASALYDKNPFFAVAPQKSRCSAMLRYSRSGMFSVFRREWDRGGSKKSRKKSKWWGKIIEENTRARSDPTRE